MLITPMTRRYTDFVSPWTLLVSSRGLTPASKMSLGVCRLIAYSWTQPWQRRLKSYGVRHPDVKMLSHPDRFASTVLLYCQLLQYVISGYTLTLTSVAMKTHVTPDGCEASIQPADTSRICLQTIQWWSWTSPMRSTASTDQICYSRSESIFLNCTPTVTRPTVNRHSSISDNIPFCPKVGKILTFKYLKY